MINSLDKKDKIKYTFVLPNQYIKELKSLSSMKIIKSVSQGVQLAIEAYIIEKKKALYLNEMEEAGKDKEFLKRTNLSQNSFEEIDSDIEKSW